MRRLKVGDTITYRPYGHQNAITANVIAIEICKQGAKYGREVEECDLDKHSNVVIGMNNNRWCYKEQLVDIK